MLFQTKKVSHNIALRFNTDVNGSAFLPSLSKVLKWPESDCFLRDAGLRKTLLLNGKKKEDKNPYKVLEQNLNAGKAINGIMAR